MLMWKEHLRDVIEGTLACGDPGRLTSAFPALQRVGLGVIDAGARDGAHPGLHEWAELIHLVGVEPDAEECRRLQSSPGARPPFRSTRYLPIALGDWDGERLLYLCRSPGVSSLYAPNQTFLARFPDADRFDVTATRRVQVRSLDGLRAEADIALPEYLGFLKIDTQGSELDILRGASALLDEEVVGLEVEVEFSRLYDGQPLFRHVDAFLAERGFSLFRLNRLSWVRRMPEIAPALSPGQLVFGDALYLKDPCAAGGGRLASAQQAEALILVALWFDLHEFALEALSDPGVASLIDVEAIRRVVVERSRRLGGPRGWRAFLGVLRALRMVVKDWEHLKHLFPFMRQYPSTWARGDGDLHSRAFQRPGSPGGSASALARSAQRRRRLITEAAEQAVFSETAKR